MADNKIVDKKKWYKSKAVWAGVLTVLITGYNSACEQFGLPVIPDFVYALLGTLGLYGRVSAKTKLS